GSNMSLSATTPACCGKSGLQEMAARLGCERYTADEHEHGRHGRCLAVESTATCGLLELAWSRPRHWRLGPVPMVIKNKLSAHKESRLKN
ncbi:MAG: hypothetical protein AVDCRST_MAG93-5041, partial [uncultured Chloroflexia bacterium]